MYPGKPLSRLLDTSVWRSTEKAGVICMFIGNQHTDGAESVLSLVDLTATSTHSSWFYPLKQQRT